MLGKTLWWLYWRELRSTLRERNVLLYVVIVPMLLYPFLLWLSMTGASLLGAQAEKTVIHVALVPPQPDLARALEQEKIKVVESSEPHEDLRRGKLEAVIESKPDTGLELVYDGRYMPSRRAQQQLNNLLVRYRDVRLEETALKRGVTIQQLQPMFYKTQDESTSGDVGRYVLGTFLPLTLLVVLSLGGLYPAVDTIAGEHERQTLDTTLMLSVSRGKILVAKYLLVASLCALSGVCNLLAVTVSLRAILAPLSSTLAERISWGWSVGSLAVIILGIIAMSMLVAAVTLLFTAHTRSFRQGQAATTPLFMAILIPAAALVDRNLVLSSSTCWVPIVNVALLWRDSLTAHVSPALALATVFSCLGWVGICLLLLYLRFTAQSRSLGLQQ